MQEGLKIQITTNAVFSQNLHEFCCFKKRFDNLEYALLKDKIENVTEFLSVFYFDELIFQPLINYAKMFCPCLFLTEISYRYM